MSAKEGGDFDEGSTCITQVQGLRACRNAGITVSEKTVREAVGYIRKSANPDGSIARSGTVIDASSFGRDASAQRLAAEPSTCAVYNVVQFLLALVGRFRKQVNLFLARVKSGHARTQQAYRAELNAQALRKQMIDGAA